jgi:hypothetical protein
VNASRGGALAVALTELGLAQRSRRGRVREPSQGSRLIVVAATALLVTAETGSARAAVEVPGASEQSIRIALVSTVGDDPLAGRLDAELRTLGFDVSRGVVSPASPIEEQVRHELGLGARAVIVADGHRTEVWIAEAGSSRVGLRQELEVDETSGLEAILALRTVEFLRISLGLVSAPAVEPAAAPPATVRRAVPPPAPPERWSAADATGGVLFAGGGAGTIAVAGVALRTQIASLVGAELCFYAPLTEAESPTSLGQIKTSVWLAGGGLVVAPTANPRLTFEGAAGALSATIRSRGIASAANMPQTDQTTRAALYARGAGRLRLASRLSVRVDLMGGYLIDAPGIVVGNDVVGTSKVATWGPGFLGAVGGAELRF